MWRRNVLSSGITWLLIIIICSSIFFFQFNGHYYSFSDMIVCDHEANEIIITEHDQENSTYSTNFITRSGVDSDSDGVNDTLDAFPTDPAASKDTDSDGCPDEWNPGMNANDSTSNPELHLDMFPFDTAACLDTDGDDLPDKLKFPSITLVEDTDDDNDGMPDQWEVDYNLDPLDPADAITDLDFDGFSNLNEYISNTNPIDPDDYPRLYIDPPERNNEDWADFITLLIFILIPAFVVSAIVGILIIRGRKYDEDFWVETFGDDNEENAGSDERSRKKYNEWRERVVSQSSTNGTTRSKYKLEIIGGPDNDDEIRPGRLHDLSRPSLAQRLKPPSSKKRLAKGKYCLWCDKGISRKYIKRCPELLLNERRCPDGPFCSKKCLNDHLNKVPHYREVNF